MSLGSQGGLPGESDTEPKSQRTPLISLRRWVEVGGTSVVRMPGTEGGPTWVQGMERRMLGEVGVKAAAYY